ncbi:DUF6760 family protein [Nostoc sp. UIC 10607]
MNLLRQEVAYIAFHLHWSYEQLMNMEHRERREWVQEISRLIASKQSGIR